MHVFHIRGFSGILLLLLAILAAVTILLVLPSAFMMVLWNALVYEGFKGAEIDIYQGSLLWGVMVVLIKLIFKPEIQLQFQNAKSAGKDSKVDAVALKNEVTEESSAEETPAKLDNQQNEG
jgi:hypothetical protein